MKFLSPNVVGPLQLEYLLFYEQTPTCLCSSIRADAGLCLSPWGGCSLLLSALLVELWTFSILGKKIKLSVMHFHLSTPLFFSYANWC